MAKAQVRKLADARTRKPLPGGLKVSALHLAQKKRDEIARIWKEESTSILAKRFSSLDAAIETIVEKIGDRMGASAAEREFLSLALTTDPGISSGLKKALRLR